MPSETDSAYPKEANLGRNCLYWNIGEVSMACDFPKFELRGRRSCEGIIDDVCLFIQNGRRPASLTQAQIVEIKTRVPDMREAQNLPPGDIL